MKEAMLYKKQADGSVRCQLCSHRCLIGKGKRGICGVRENHQGTLYSLVYDKVIAAHVDPIEKKPFYHVLPGTESYSIATVGCNFICHHCQNAEISQLPREHHVTDFPGNPVTPEGIVTATLRQACQSIAYTYTEPTIFFELAYDTARLANEQGLKNLFVTNGYMTAEALDSIAPYLDGANVDLKGFDDQAYRKVCGGNLQPVQDTIRRMHAHKIWVEVTTLIIPTHNDSREELQGIAEFIASVDPAIPWHISAFFPHYKMSHLPPTPVATILDAVAIGKQAGLRYVYSGNIRHDDSSDTRCPACGTRVLSRAGFTLLENRVKNGTCEACGQPLDGIFV